MQINKEQHQKDIKQFTKERIVYETYAKTLEKILNEAAKIYAPLSIIQTRAKNVSSFAEKIIRKNKYKNPLKDITDLCGARIITQTQEQIVKICGFIRDNFLIDQANSLDVSERLHVREFGYRSVHYIVTPVKNEILGVKIPDELKDKRAEIQVRTLLQHTWSDVLHDRLYKTALNIPKEWERESARLAALLENADENISRITTLSDSYTANYGNRMDKETLRSEIDTLKTILENEPEEKNKPAIALKIARLTKFSGNPGFILEKFPEFVDIKSKVQAEIKVELGYTLCREHKDKPGSLLFKKGEKYLTGIAGIKEIEVDTSKLALNKDPENIQARILALQYLAEIYDSSKSVEKARNLYNLAYQMDSENPYLFAKLLEYNSQFCEQKLLISNNITHSIEKCCEHIKLGIESLKAYFTIGRFYILLGNYLPALEAYLKAVDLFISGQVCISKETLNSELESLSRLSCNEKDKTGIECASIILHLANVIMFNDKKSLAVIKEISFDLKSLPQPVTIIAGGSDNIELLAANKYSAFLNDAVRRYSGTIISGGTVSGIPGLLGSAVEIARKMGNKKINLLGYIPKRNMKGVKVDRSYKTIITGCDTFTPWEAVRMWCDLFISGIKLEDITMLGIDGGKIAAIEYRMALAFGAHVGIVKESGRAANETLKDTDWCNHKNIHPVPNESESVWALVNYNKQDSLLSAKQREDTAKIIHHNYVEDQLKNKKPDENIKKWENLREDFKNSNLNQALFINEILTLNGFGIRKIIDDGKGVTSFSKEEELKMSKLEHGRFVAERLLQGWTYGPVKNTEKKISPYLVAWDEVPADVQKFDFNSIMNYPLLLKMAGLEIYRIENK